MAGSVEIVEVEEGRAWLLAPPTQALLLRGEDRLHSALAAGLDLGRFDLRYQELDPDIFGSQLNTPAYADIERIAAIGAVITRRREV